MPRQPALLAVSLLMGWFAHRLGLGSITRPGPGFFPFWTCFGLAATSVYLMTRYLRQSPEDEASTEPEAVFTLAGYRRVLSVMAGTAIFGLLLEVSGFLATTFIFMAFCWLVIGPPVPPPRAPDLGGGFGGCLRALRQAVERALPPRPAGVLMGDLFANLYFGFSVSLAPYNLLACFMGVFVGTAIGVLPGLGPVATMSLLLPITIKMEPTAAIIIMAGVFYGAMYGGSTTSILLNLPGEASSVVTTLDGYQMARQGRAGPALAICAWGSFIAGTLGVLGITLMAPALAEMAVKIGPPELVALLCLSFLLVIQFSGGSRPRAAASALLGFLLSTVGLDPVESTPRYDFGTFTLMDGVGFAPLVIGLFGISEVLINLEKEEKMEVFKGRIKGSVAHAPGLARLRTGHRARQHRRFFHGDPARHGHHRTPFSLLFSGAENLQKTREIRHGRDRGRGGARGGQQLGHGGQHDSPPHAGHRPERCGGRSDGGLSHPRRAARPPHDLRAPPPSSGGW